MFVSMVLKADNYREEKKEDIDNKIYNKYQRIIIICRVSTSFLSLIFNVFQSNNNNKHLLKFKIMVMSTNRNRLC